MILFGKQIVLHLLERHPKSITEIMLAKEIDKKLFSKFAALGVKIIKLDAKKAQSLAHGGNHQGFFAQVNGFDFTEAKELKSLNFLAITDGATDVGNIGAIIRNGHCLGVDGFCIGNVGSIPFDGIIRSSAGAALEAKISLVPNLADFANELKMDGFTLYGANSKGQDIKNIKIETKKAIFLGSEGDGLSKRIESKMDFLVSIKMRNDFDSLNVSSASAILFDRMMDD